MKYNTGFFDGLFGKKKTVKISQNDGTPKEVTVTEAWLRKMLEAERTSMSEKLQDPIPFHVISPNGSETRHLRIGSDITREQYQKHADPITGALYGLTVFEDGVPKTSVIGKQFWEQAKNQFAEIDRVHQEYTESCMIEVNELMNTKKNPIQPPSAELQEWLNTREKAKKARAAFSKTDGHIMLRNSVINPEELDEPLRTEAINYLRQRGEWHD